MGFFICLFLSELLTIILTPTKKLPFATDIKQYERITSIGGDVETLSIECIPNWETSEYKNLGCTMVRGDSKR